MINATALVAALVAALGDVRSFGRGRDLSAWLGLTPRQATTGGQPRMLGISKRGNRYLRGNLIHGARAMLPGVLAQETPLGRWARALSERAHRNVVVVALAALLACAGWLLAPALAAQTDQLVQTLPRSFQQFEQRVSRYAWGEWLIQQTPPVDSLLPSSGNFLARASPGSFPRRSAWS